MTDRLRFVLLLPDGPLDLPFTDGAAQLLPTAYRGAPNRRVNLRITGPAQITVDIGEPTVVDGSHAGPGRLRLAPGSTIGLGSATGVVLPVDPALKPRSYWSDRLASHATAAPHLLLLLGTLGDPVLLPAAVKAAAKLSLAAASEHRPRFAALIAAGLAAKDTKTRSAAALAAAGKESLLDPDLVARVASVRDGQRAKQQEQAAAAAAFAARTDPEHDGGVGRPTIAWDLVPGDVDRGHGWFRGSSSLPPGQRPRSSIDGAALAHLCTLLIPREYRTRDAGVAALALFQDLAPGQVTAVPAAHPGERRLVDHIGRDFAVVWLTADELRRGPAGAGHRWVELRARMDDPNAGLPTHGPGYKRLPPGWFAGRARNHFGGTTGSISKLPPRYLHIDQRDVGGSFAGDDAHLDLETPAIVWGED